MVTKLIYRTADNTLLAELTIYANDQKNGVIYGIKSYVKEPSPSMFQVVAARQDSRGFELQGAVHSLPCDGYTGPKEILGADTNTHSILLINGKHQGYDIRYGRN